MPCPQSLTLLTAGLVEFPPNYYLHNVNADATERKEELVRLFFVQYVIALQFCYLNIPCRIQACG